MNGHWESEDIEIAILTLLHPTDDIVEIPWPSLRSKEAILIIRHTSTSTTSRRIWLRRSVPSAPNPPGAWQDLELSVIGNAAARETFVTATSHMAAIWTDLFRSMIAQGPELRWRGSGPGVGRDARIAFSGLFGRYMARAYLTEYEGVRVLVPLDAAKRELEQNGYVIKKDPQSRGYEADWIGIDNLGLVIVEAKGTFDSGKASWRGPYSRPPILQTAIEQAERTAVFDIRNGRKLPAKRWAIASRWGTEDNLRDPTLLAWDSEEDKLSDTDFRTIANTLLLADTNSLMRQLGHSGDQGFLGDELLSERFPRSTRIRVGERNLELGFAALVGPFGVHPLRRANDLMRMSIGRDLNLNIAVASLSSRYVTAVTSEEFWREGGERRVPPSVNTSQDNISRWRVGYAGQETTDKRFSNRAGLTLVWPEAGEPVLLRDE